MKYRKMLHVYKKYLLLALVRNLTLVLAWILTYNPFYSKSITNLMIYFYNLSGLNYNDSFAKKIYSKHFSFDHKAIWSAPRSGNHWVRFIAEYLTGCPTSGCIPNSTDIPICLNTFPCEEHPLAHVNPENPFILYKSHWVYPMTSGSAILLLIRDYHEYIARLSIDKTTKDRRLQNKAFDYLELIAAYDRFCGAKILIYYEDLLKYPEKEICRIKDFLGASDERYKAFMARYDYYVQLSKQGKNRDWRGSNSTGDFKFYQKNLSKQERLIRENFFHKICTIKRYQCVKPYLARYE